MAAAKRIPNQLLTWTDGEGNWQGVAFRPLGGGQMLAESSSFGSEFISCKLARAWIAELETNHGAQWLKPVRKLSAKQINQNLRRIKP